MNNDNKKNEHDLNNAGNTLGQVYNVNKFDSGTDHRSTVWRTIKRILIIAVVAFCFLYVIINLILGNNIFSPY